MTLHMIKLVVGCDNIEQLLEWHAGESLPWVMHTRQTPKRTAELTAGGYPEDTPVAVVYKATWPEQEVVRGTLADIAEKAAHIKKTALILVGDFLRESDKRSKLYDPAFAHACREAETP